jgi:hypothetical protein
MRPSLMCCELACSMHMGCAAYRSQGIRKGIPEFRWLKSAVPSARRHSWRTLPGSKRHC